MNSKDRFLAVIRQATQGLPSIRQTMQEFTLEQVKAEIKRVNGFPADMIRRESLNVSSTGIAAFTESLVAAQMLIFHRNIQQMTAQSLADNALVGLAAVTTDPDNLSGLIATVSLFCDYLERKSLAKPGLADEFDDLVQRQRPDFDDFDPDQPDEAEELDLGDLFHNQPVVLVTQYITATFGQLDSDEVDRNAFIAELVKKHQTGQLQLAYGLFLTPQPIYDSLQMWSERMRYQADYYSEDEVARFVGTLWSFARGLTTDGLIALSKLVHQYLKFCLNNGTIQAREYAKLLKYSNRGIIRAVAMGVTAGQDIDLAMRRGKESVGLADKIFTKPNYTINVTQARKVLADLHRTPDATPINPDAKLVLKRSLSQRQIASEQVKVDTWLANLDQKLGDAVSPTDLTVYHRAILQLHLYMGSHLHRQVKQWSRDSLMAGLIDLFQSNRELDSRPTFLRYLELYLGDLGDSEVVTSYPNLMAGFSKASYEYICRSTNALLAEA